MRFLSYKINLSMNQKGSTRGVGARSPHIAVFHRGLHDLPIEFSIAISVAVVNSVDKSIRLFHSEAVVKPVVTSVGYCLKSNVIDF